MQADVTIISAMDTLLLTTGDALHKWIANYSIDRMFDVEHLQQEINNLILELFLRCAAWPLSGCLDVQREA